MNNKLLVFALICFLTLIGGFLRFYKIASNPISLNIDEVSDGYSAYSILKTGRDENGVFMPLAFKSTGDYKNPVLIYSLVTVIAVFGLSEFSVRFTTALFGALSIPAFFLLAYILVKNKKIAIISTILLTISPWHIYYSRVASESLIGLFFLILGMYCFQRLKQRLIWSVLASFFLIISFYSYHSLRFFIPLFLSLLILIKVREKGFKSKYLILFVALSTILSLPLIYLMLFGSVNTRASMVFLTQDIDYTRNIILDHIQRGGENFLLFFLWIKRYLNYFQPDFLFFNGLNMTANNTLGLGVLYLYELLWLVLGMTELIRRKIENKKVIISWILLGILPASLTNNEQSSVRSLIILPMLLLITSLGAIQLFQLINAIRIQYFKIALIAVYIFLIGITLIQAFLIFAVHFPQQRGEAFMEGTKETVLFALKNKDKYKEIVYDPYRGIEAPYIVNIPHMYILFYSQYDPFTYQTEGKRFGNELFGFDKFTIRRINWRVDKDKQGTLFIGSPWSLPEKDLKTAEILKKVYLSTVTWRC